MFYLVKSSWFIKKLYRNCTWSIPGNEADIYLTFDDGPNPKATTFILDELKKYQAKATFFCIGKNVVLYPEIYRRIIDEGHAVGNHTYNHLNGWNTSDNVYLDDIAEAAKYIDTTLFRPPYGRIRGFQLQQLALPKFKLSPIMWSVLSGDFDESLSKERCLQNVILNTNSGSIVVFHDSEKAYPRMAFAVPGTLDYFSKKGYNFKKITNEIITG